MIIITGVCLFLLGTSISASKTKVKYEGPSKITVTEEKDDNIILPGLGAPPYAPSFFHQGSNFYFNPQFLVPGEYIPPDFERVIAPLPQKEYKNLTFLTPIPDSHKITEKEPVVEIIQGPDVPIAYPEFGSVSMYPSISNVPILIEDPIKTAGGLVISEVNVQVDAIPPPPELPPLIVSEMPKPDFYKEAKKRIILVPAVPEFPHYQPSPVVVAERPVFTDCVQNIVLDRVLPNIALKNGKLVELVSIPATKRAPVVSSIVF